jgi:prephenate dehydrogenase
MRLTSDQQDLLAHALHTAADVFDADAKRVAEKHPSLATTMQEQAAEARNLALAMETADHIEARP